jgi:hypothetical protein
MPRSSKYTIALINESMHEDSILTAISFDVLRRLPCGNNYRRVICICECGNTCIKAMQDLVGKKTVSCGCVSKRNQLLSVQKYHPYIPAIYDAWERMVNRCYNQNHPKYKFYGGIGVEVCAEWKENYQVFLNWSLENGWKEGLQIDKDTKGNGKLYSPDTCAWISKKENSRARKHLLRVVHNGKHRLLVEVCEELNINTAIVRQRMKRDGMTLDQALSVPNTGQGNFKLRKKHYKNEK